MSSTLIKDYAFAPITNEQKSIWNFKELNKQLDICLKSAAKKILDNEEVDETNIVNGFLESIKETYFSTQEKKKKATAEKKKQGRSSYILFCDDYRESTAAEHPELKATEVASLLGQKWNALSLEEKQPYIDHANEIKEQIKAGTYVFPEKAKRNSKKQPKTESVKSESTKPDSKEGKSTSSKSDKGKKKN